MPRSVNAVAARQKRKKLLSRVKGQFGRRKNVWTVAKNAYEKGMCYAYRDRRNKKRDFRGLWINRINAGVRQYGMSYSVFIKKLSDAKIIIDRKIMADLIDKDPKSFKAIVERVSSKN